MYRDLNFSNSNHVFLRNTHLILWKLNESSKKKQTKPFSTSFKKYTKKKRKIKLKGDGTFYKKQKKIHVQRS